MKLRTVSLNRIVLWTVLMAVSVACISAAANIGSPPSVAIGAGVMVANFSLIRMLVSRLITPRASKAATLFLVIAKFGLVLGLVAGVFLQFPVEPLSFATGATLLLVACVVEAALLGRPVDALIDELPASSTGSGPQN
ncbi:MAG: hypothetical protein ACI8TX_000908 [Hyphomicrobiaceae bacterium]|jgi:hypothetical protein